MRRIVPVLTIAFVAVSTARCALVSGLDGLTIGDAADASSADVADANAVDAAPADAPPDVAPPDGGCTCVPIPPGWTAVRFASATTTPCPIGDTSTDLVLSPVATTASGSCACTCTTTTTCADPNVEFSGAASCSNLAGIAKLTTSGACLTFPIPPNGLDGMRVSAISGTCKATPTAFPPTSSGTGRRCSPPPSACGTGLGCDGATGPFAACVAHDGDQACPNGYAKKVATAASVTDGRVCNGCGCTTTNPACSYDVKSFKNSACTQLSDGATGISGVCVPFVPEAFYTATVKSTSTCTASPGTATGATTIVGAQTICCKG